MSKAAKQKQEKSELLKALEFVAVAQEKDQLNYKTHCLISHDLVYATDGFITTCHPISSIDLQTAPRTHDLIKALALLADAKVTLNQSWLTVSHGRKTVKVPCTSPDSVPQICPDEPCAKLPSTVLAALATVAALADESAARVAFCSVLLRSGSAASTNGYALLEAWHGEQLPFDRLVIPKAALKALDKTKQVPTQIGVSKNSVTFWFASGAWLKAQLYCEEYPDIDRVLNVELNTAPPSSDFFEAIKTAIQFSDDNKVYFVGNQIKSSLNDNEGATIQLMNPIAKSLFFNAGYILQLEDCIETMTINEDRALIYFYGQNVRGAIVGGKL